MTSGVTRRRSVTRPWSRRWLATCAAFAAVMIAVAGCGGSSGGASQKGEKGGASAKSGTNANSSQSSAAAQAVTAGSAEPSFSAPGPSFKVAANLQGKTIWYVANGLNFPFSENLVAGVKEAAAVRGMKVVPVDGAGQIAKAASLIQQGVSQKVAAIVIQAFPTEALVAPIKEAKAAGIPVIQINEAEPGLPSPQAQAAGVFANVASCYGCGGESLADIVAANTSGKANAVFIDVPEIKTTLAELEGFQKRLKQLCSECTVSVKSAPVAQWGGLATLVGSVLRSEPNVNYIVPALDAMVQPMEPAIYAASAQERVHVAAYNATQPNMKNLQKGVLIGGLVGNPEVWIGWGVVDETLRALSGQHAVANENIPNRTFTNANVKSLNLGAASITWYGSANFRGGYKQLWK